MNDTHVETQQSSKTLYWKTGTLGDGN